MTYMYNDGGLAHVPVEGPYNKFTLSLQFFYPPPVGEGGF